MVEDTRVDGERSPTGEPGSIPGQQSHCENCEGTYWATRIEPLDADDIDSAAIIEVWVEPCPVCNPNGVIYPDNPGGGHFIEANA